MPLCLLLDHTMRCSCADDARGWKLDVSVTEGSFVGFIDQLELDSDSRSIQKVRIVYATIFG